MYAFLCALYVHLLPFFLTSFLFPSLIYLSISLSLSFFLHMWIGFWYVAQADLKSPDLQSCSEMLRIPVVCQNDCSLSNSYALSIVYY